MLTKDEDITSYQLLLKQDRVLVKQLVNRDFFFFFFFFNFSKKMGQSGDGKRNILLGWPKWNQYFLWPAKLVSWKS